MTITISPANSNFACELGLKPEEVEHIAQLLQAEPTPLHIRLFAALWSEHCSYKRSRRWLRELPTTAPWVLEGPGEGAGIVQIDEDTAIAFKMESHNHPSAVEPLQGAATGVGGILRDIISMGARPIGLLNGLRFAPLHRNPRHHTLFQQVVQGIAWYGNCIGIPTVGGDLQFAPSYQDNPLVNVMALGRLSPNAIVPSRAQGPGSLLVLFGPATGREGLHGATFASQDLDTDGFATSRSSVQIGDPFSGKLLMEATLELAQRASTIGIQDLGAAGLLCASTEMAHAGGCGIALQLDAVHTREAQLAPWEILLSETQERMLACIPPEQLSETLALFERWELPASVVGTTIKEPHLRLQYHGQTLLEVPTQWLIEDSPEYNLPTASPQLPSPQPTPTPSPAESQNTALQQLTQLNQCDRRWIFQQFDFMIGCQTLVPPGQANAAVLKPPDKTWALAATLGGLPLPLRPYGTKNAAIGMIAECTRDLIAVGATPLAITNCLNFPSPEIPTQYHHFIETIQGMKEACNTFVTPVTGGNVSFYNQSHEHSIDPTPIIGMLGKIENFKDVPASGFQHPGESIAVVGFSFPLSTAPWDLEACIRSNQCILQLLQQHQLQSCRSINLGGLWRSLALSAFAHQVGFQIQHISPMDLFQEGGHRFLISFLPQQKDAVQTHCQQHDVSFQPLGTSGGNQLQVEGHLQLSLSQAYAAWSQPLFQEMDGTTTNKSPHPSSPSSSPTPSSLKPSQRHAQKS